MFVGQGRDACTATVFYSAAPCTAATYMNFRLGTCCNIVFRAWCKRRAMYVRKKTKQASYKNNTGDTVRVSTTRLACTTSSPPMEIIPVMSALDHQQPNKYMLHVIWNSCREFQNPLDYYILYFEVQYKVQHCCNFESLRKYDNLILKWPCPLLTRGPLWQMCAYLVHCLVRRSPCQNPLLGPAESSARARGTRPEARTTFVSILAVSPRFPQKACLCATPAPARLRACVLGRAV